MNRQETYALAQQLTEQGQVALARALYLDYAAIKAEYLPAHQALTMSYINTQEYESALRHAHIWQLLEPLNPQAYWLYGQLLQANGGTELEVLKIYRKLERVAPNWEDMHLAMAKIYFGQRQIQQATDYFERALKNVRGNLLATSKVQWEYAMMLLTTGEFRKGWQYHEARLELIRPEGLNLVPLPAKVWKGANLKGKTIVVHGEQGIGDEIMYASMLNDLLEQGANVVLACYALLVKVMQESFPKIKVVPHTRSLNDIEQSQRGNPPQWWQDLKPVHYQIPMGSLANILRPNPQSFPKTAYLTVDSVRQAEMKMLLSAQASKQNISLEGKTLMALAWCGNLANPHGRAKSIELSELSELEETVLDKNIVFVSLQNRQYGKQALEQQALPIIDMSEYVDDFADTLALASLCAHVVTIDTSYFHICAAAGLSVTLLLRRNCDWRFGWISEDCMWYPNVQTIRQSTDMDWRDVVQKLKNMLDQWS